MFRILLEEDTQYGDITSELIIPTGMRAEALIIAKERCVVAGVEYLRKNLEAMGIHVIESKRDGDVVSAGCVVMRMRGHARDLLKVERTLLNILGRMSGIATETRKIVEMVRKINPNVRIAATRKTLWGYLDKVAVMIGGGDPHRWNLGDMVMIKDNHIALVGLRKAIERAKKVSFTKKIEVEVENEEDAIMAAEMGANIVMLDNMDPEDVCRIAEKLKKYGVMVEVSGGINPENVMEYAQCDVDIISMGHITHSVRACNFSMEIEKID